MTSSSLTRHLQTDLDSSMSERARVEAAFDRHSSATYRFVVVRVGGDRHLADDLMQQLWLQCIGSQTVTIPDDRLEFWFRGIAKNLLRSHWRTTRNRPTHLPIAEPALASELAEKLSSEELPAAALERREVCDQLSLALTALPTVEQELMVGYYFRDRTHAELAELLGISTRSVEGRLYRARQALRQELLGLRP